MILPVESLKLCVKVSQLIIVLKELVGVLGEMCFSFFCSPCLPSGCEEESEGGKMREAFGVRVTEAERKGRFKVGIPWKKRCVRGGGCAENKVCLSIWVCTCCDYICLCVLSEREGEYIDT